MLFRSEADDIIGTLVPRHAPHENILILSSDGDFLQLQTYGKNVKQYNPSLKKYVVSENPVMDLKEKIIRGDKGDGIPNILSKDDVFVTGGRSKPITEAKIINWLNQEPKDFCNEEMLRNYSRNESVIDLTKIPQKKIEEILDQYDNSKGHTKMEFMNYMMANKLKNLLQVMDEF